MIDISWLKPLFYFVRMAETNSQLIQSHFIQNTPLKSCEYRVALNKWFMFSNCMKNVVMVGIAYFTLVAGLDPLKHTQPEMNGLRQILESSPDST